MLSANRTVSIFWQGEFGEKVLWGTDPESLSQSNRCTTSSRSSPSAVPFLYFRQHFVQQLYVNTHTCSTWQVFLLAKQWIVFPRSYCWRCPDDPFLGEETKSHICAFLLSLNLPAEPRSQGLMSCQQLELWFTKKNDTDELNNSCRILCRPESNDSFTADKCVFLRKSMVVNNEFGGSMV